MLGLSSATKCQCRVLCLVSRSPWDNVTVFSGEPELSRGSQWGGSCSCSWHELTADTGLWPTKTFFHTDHLLCFLNSAFSQCLGPVKTPHENQVPVHREGNEAELRSWEFVASALRDAAEQCGSQRWPRVKGGAELGVPRYPHDNLLVSHQPLECVAKPAPHLVQVSLAPQKSVLPLRSSPSCVHILSCNQTQKIPFYESSSHRLCLGCSRINCVLLM